ncbi:hypothetical protein ES319_A08G198700v1 [Gossypium barbadense]|uniref:Uncharacterized protein n=2 Tax=Gossypium TaxID=3633 RepID=A0A5J5UUX2_GOSBA|nr:hypothetical protein ES319_A08G198700v1 [Gossypium barbadense]TYH07267.1 hypothetical protein ES288_A08G220200v1 [Gossypium darwinii]
MVAYKLDLPATAKIHPVFHVSLLCKCIGTPEQQVTPLHLVDSTATLILQPVATLATRTVNRSGHSIVQYLIQWDGFPQDTTTWEDKDHMLRNFPNWNLQDKVLSKPGGTIVNGPQSTTVNIQENRVNGPTANTRPNHNRNTPQRFNDFVIGAFSAEE